MHFGTLGIAALPLSLVGLVHIDDYPVSSNGLNDDKILRSNIEDSSEEHHRTVHRLPWDLATINTDNRRYAQDRSTVTSD